MNNISYIPLSSVGCFIDNKGFTYPMNEDGTPDLMSNISIEECTEEWFSTLSSEDNLVVQNIKINI